MNYRLVVISHGNAPFLDRTLESFAEMVHPPPTARSIVLDGRDARLPDGGWDAILRHDRPRGFGAAMSTAWEHARLMPEPYVFWLENDFVFRRVVPVAAMAGVLDSRPNLAQLALVRQPLNEREVAAGGWPHLHEWVERTHPGHGAFSDGYRYLESRWGWTTNPSLIPHRTFERYPWPTGHESEGRFGIYAKANDPHVTFGIWGLGEPWVEHIGVRTGKGY